MYEVCIAENLPWWKEMKEVLKKYGDEEEVDENACIPDRKARKRKCEQRCMDGRSAELEDP